MNRKKAISWLAAGALIGVIGAVTALQWGDRLPEAATPVAGVAVSAAFLFPFAAVIAVIAAMIDRRAETVAVAVRCGAIALAVSPPIVVLLMARLSGG